MILFSKISTVRSIRVVLYPLSRRGVAPWEANRDAALRDSTVGVVPESASSTNSARHGLECVRKLSMAAIPLTVST